MTKIYLIKESGGSSDDAWESTLFAVRDEEQAKVEVRKLFAHHAFCTERLPEITRALHDSFAASRLEQETPADTRERVELAQRAAHAKAVELGCSDEHLKLLGLLTENCTAGSLSFVTDANYFYQELELR